MYLEVDSLITSGCLNGAQRYYRLVDELGYAIRRLEQLPHVVVYVDAGAADAIGPHTMARWLGQAGVKKAQGFFLNATHFDWTSREIYTVSRSPGGSAACTSLSTHTAVGADRSPRPPGSVTAMRCSAIRRVVVSVRSVPTRATCGSTLSPGSTAPVGRAAGAFLAHQGPRCSAGIRRDARRQPRLRRDRSVLPDRASERARQPRPAQARQAPCQASLIAAGPRARSVSRSRTPGPSRHHPRREARR